MMRNLILTLLLLLCATSRAQVPLIAHWPMDEDNVTDTTGKLTAQLKNAAAAEGKTGKALLFQHAASAEVRTDGTLIDRIGPQLTITAWVWLDAYGANDGGIISKRAVNVQAPFILSIGKTGNFGFEGFDGANWVGCFSGPNVVPLKRWAHVALTYDAKDSVRLHVDGKQVAVKKAARALASNDQPLVFGRDPFRGPFTGKLDEVRLYAAALTPEQLQADIAGTLATRPAKSEDFPPPQHLVRMALVRFDMPMAFTDGYGRTRHPAERQAGPDAVDWPAITLNGQRLFENKAEESLDLRLRSGGEAKPLFRQPSDDLVQPGEHWLRALQWLWGQRFAYTTDRTARSWHNDYELWTFPVRIAGEAELKNIALSWDGKVIYTHAGPLKSLTLLLPASLPDMPYSLTVDGRGPVTFHAGLEPVTPGSPRDVISRTSLTFPGAGPKITVTTPENSARFACQKEWDEDLAAMASATASAAKPRTPSMSAHLGIDVDRSPLGVNFIALPHGMSSGSYYDGEHADAAEEMRKHADVEGYAKYVAEAGYDRVFERINTNSLNKPDDPRSPDALAAALAARGVQIGIIPGNDWKRPFMAHSNIAFFSHNLPDYHAPLYREIQLAVQHLSRHGNVAGISIGADNAGYVSFWEWAPPIPNRPWGEAFEIFQKGLDLRVPYAKSHGGGLSTAEFLQYIARYDQTFEQYGYFARAVTEIDPHLAATTGSFGSSPGVGGRGGYPWATIPGKPIFKDMPIQQAYDWNEQSSSKPLHLVSLIDRLRSYDPQKPTWAIVDDFKLFFGREARQRAYALALTRGIQSIGTTFLPNPVGPKARPEIIKDQKELYAWIHRFGGVYAMTEPLPTIGVMYVNEQALLRRVIQDEKNADELFNGSHEGKTTEAMFLCHAAGFPAKIITPDELKRGLPASMKAILLVGLHKTDGTWQWYSEAEDALRRFAENGGRVITDDESTCPFGATATTMRLRAYVKNADIDPAPLLLSRNADNITKLREAMKDITPAIATSHDPTIWAIPSAAGDVQYITVVNYGFEEGKNASKFVKPQTGKLAWSTDRPIYDVRLGQRIEPDKSATVDLTTDGFQWYALPPKPITAPHALVARRPDGFYGAKVSVGQDIRGVPVALTIAGPAEIVTLHTATGRATKLPITDELPGKYRITTTELLSGQSSQTTLETKPAPARREPARTLPAFAARKDVPLTIALTDAQTGDEQTRKLADKLAAFYASRGRRAGIRRIAPGDVVLSQQPLKTVQTHPRWRTIDSDLILLGTPADNPLLFDQYRGQLLPPGSVKPAQPMLHLTFSPFVGERNALNILATPADLPAAVEEVIRP